MSNASASTSAATDVAEFFTDLDGGQFERMLSVALSKTAAAVTDNKLKGKVVIELEMKPVTGTSMVHVQHQLKFQHPTRDGEAIERVKRTTTLHVGKYGALSLVPESQIPLLDRAGQVTNG